jgi:hypothetical protein
MAATDSDTIRIDLHVHTRRHSPCAEALDPDHLPERLESLGLDGLVITEHDHLWSAEDIEYLNRRMRHGRIYRGVEVSSRNGHFIVIGLQQLDGIAPGIGIDVLVRQAKAQQAAVIWAHPQLCYTNTPAPCTLQTLPQGIHAVEVISSVTSGGYIQKAKQMADRMGWAQVGGSDAHNIHQVGFAVTLFKRLPADEKELAEAILKGWCVAEQSSLSSGKAKASCF